MIDYTITNEYLDDGWIYKGTIYFPNGIPYNIIYTEDFSIDIINPFTLNSIVINDAYGIPINNAVVQDLGYSLDYAHYEENQIKKIEANLVKNGGYTFSNTVNSITVYLMPTYRYNGRTVVSFDMAKIMVTFKLNGITENFELRASFLPSIRRTNNYTIVKSNAQGTDSVFGTEHSRIVNPENDTTKLLPTSGYNFNNVFNDNNINLSANFNYDETVNGLYIGPRTIKDGYLASAILYAPENTNNMEIHSYWYDPDRGVKESAAYEQSNYSPATASMFKVAGSDIQVAYFHDFFTEYSGEYSAVFTSATITQKVWPLPVGGTLPNMMKNRLTLSCIVSADNAYDMPQPDLSGIYGYQL